MPQVCPTLSNMLMAEQCQEQNPGLGYEVYVGVKSDLKAPLTLAEDGSPVYSTPELKTGKYLIKFECKDESQQITGSSQGKRKRFKLTFNHILEAVDKQTAMNARALNNLNIFIIVRDGDDYQIMYDPAKNVIFDADGISTDTGTTSSDDRVTKLAAVLNGAKWPNLWVTPPEGGFDSLCNFPAGE